MDGLIVLAVAAVVGLPVAVVALLVAVARLSGRVGRLEGEVAALRARAVAAARTAGEEAREAPGPWAAPIAAADGAERPGGRSGPPPLPPLAEAEPAPAPSVPAGPTWGERALAWARANWFYLASAASLALAGIFLVQYGAERGLLTPSARVALALALGAALVGAGEWVRRRWGDEGGSSAALPSTLSGAGIVTLYAAVLGARALYGLIGPMPALLGLAGVSALALGLGWRYGPLLAAVGVTGATAAPFLVGGSAEAPGGTFLYLGLVATVGLGLDALRRWGWVSGLALGLPLLAAGVVQLALPGFPAFVALMAWLAAAAVLVPRLEALPTHPGPSLLEDRRGASPPVRIAVGGVAGAALVLSVLALLESAPSLLLALAVLAGLAAALALLSARAPGLVEAPAAPALLFLVLLALGPGVPPVPAPPNLPWASLALLLALGVSAAAALRSLRGTHPVPWGAAAAGFAPLAALALELAWAPAEAMGRGAWAAQVLAVAAGATALAGLYGRRDGDRRRAAYAALGALGALALALTVVLSDAALTVALAALVASAAWLDRRLDLPEMAWAVAAGIAALGWRLVVAPGLPAALGDAPLGGVVLSFGAAILALGAARVLLRPGRGGARAGAESAAGAFLAVLLSVLLWRWAAAWSPEGATVAHWTAGLLATIWGALGLAQLRRAATGGPLGPPRRVLAAAEGAVAALGLLAAVGPLNPLLGGAVLGPWPLDTLLLAYGVPALALWLAARLLPRWRRPLDLGAGALALLWAGLAIRRYWRGDVALPGIGPGELYSYTVALLLLGVGLLLRALQTGSGALRRAATVTLGLAVAKVFLVDAAGLSGLLRVGSFLALGLVLAGLAWLDRWAAERETAGRETAS